MIAIFFSCGENVFIHMNAWMIQKISMKHHLGRKIFIAA